MLPYAPPPNSPMPPERPSLALPVQPTKADPMSGKHRAGKLVEQNLSVHTLDGGMDNQMIHIAIVDADGDVDYPGGETY